MADFPTMRRMEDFLINPTYAVMDDQYQSSISGDSYLPTRPLDKMFNLVSDQKIADSNATTQQFRSEPVSFHGYTSEEEVASPTESDNMSFHSATSESEMTGSGEDYAIEEVVIATCTPVKQQCSKAHAITLVSAGKAKVVSLPKIDTTPTTPLERTVTSTSTSPSIRPPVSRFQDLSPDSGSQLSSRASTSSSPRSLSDQSPASTAPSSVFEQPKRSTSIRKQPSLTRSQTSAASPQSSLKQGATKAARPSRTVGFLDHDPFTTNSSEAPTTPTSPRVRKLHKFSSSFGLNVFGKSNKRNVSLNGPTSDDLEAVKEPEAVLVPSTLPSPKPTRSTSKRGRMIPRGANERAAPIVLPACPKNYDNDATFATVTSWPARKDSTTRARLHNRQRSVSAALVTAEA